MCGTGERCSLDKRILNRYAIGMPPKKDETKNQEAPLTDKRKMYPSIHIERISHPNRLYAIPIVGMLVKVIILIPFFIVLFFVLIGYFFISIINSCYVLFNGTYWDVAHRYITGYLHLSLKMHYFLFGLTDKYPAFTFEPGNFYTMKIEKPQHPNRLWAIPFFGGIARLFVLIPFFIFVYILQYASWFGAIGASFEVLVKGRYPESSFELARDYVRLSLSASVFSAGLSDAYPNFWISMNHKKIKIALIIAAILYMIVGNVMNAQNRARNYERSYSNDSYQYYQNPTSNTY